MKQPFQNLREAAINVAEALSCTLDEQFSVTGEGYEFDRYVFKIQQQGAYPGMTFTLSISGDDIDQHFEGAP